MTRHPIALAILILAATARPARATPLIVDRIIAIVDDSPILLSELRERARPFKLELEQQGLPEEKRAAEAIEIDHAVLDRLIDERLICGEAFHRGLSVTDAEVTAALSEIAKRSNLTVDALLEEARRVGLTDASYRDEIRRQILEGKMIWLAKHDHPAPAAAGPAKPPPATTDAALEKTREELIASLRKHAYIEVRR